MRSLQRMSDFVRKSLRLTWAKNIALLYINLGVSQFKKNYQWESCTYLSVTQVVQCICRLWKNKLFEAEASLLVPAYIHNRVHPVILLPLHTLLHKKTRSQ